MIPRILLALLPALAAASPAPQSPAHIFARDCTKNNCLRALVAGSYPERQVSADCSAFLRTTYIPDTSTIASYTTSTVVVTNVISNVSPVL
jgi:hypothetical protein